MIKRIKQKLDKMKPLSLAHINILIYTSHKKDGVISRDDVRFETDRIMMEVIAFQITRGKAKDEDINIDMYKYQADRSFFTYCGAVNQLCQRGYLSELEPFLWDETKVGCNMITQGRFKLTEKGWKKARSWGPNFVRMRYPMWTY